jgi:hypothetical protein
MSQSVAHSCLTLAGKQWVNEKVETLTKNREVIWNAVKHMDVIRTSGNFSPIVK